MEGLHIVPKIYTHKYPKESQISPAFSFVDIYLKL